MSSPADEVKPRRQRIRRRLVRLVILDPNNPALPRRDGRRNPHGWRWANEARLHHGASGAMEMLALRLVGRYRADAIAEMFGTTRNAVYQRLYRLRQGFYRKALNY